MKADITDVMNGNISNANVGASAAIDESKIAFDTSSGHTHDGTDSTAVASGSIYRAFISGSIVEYVAADQIKVGSGAIEIAGSIYSTTSYSTTIDLDTATHWVEGSSQRGVSKWAYVYAYNDSGTTWDVKYWLLAPQFANTGADNSGPLVYRQTGDVWYRCIGAVRLNASGSGNIILFYQRGNFIWYDDVYSNSLLDVFGGAGTATTFTAASLVNFVPAISQECEIKSNAVNNGFTYYTRVTGSSATNGMIFGDNGGVTHMTHKQPLNSSQSMDYKVSDAQGVYMWIAGYRVNIR